MFNAMCDINSDLSPISKYEFDQWHKWPYKQIANELIDTSIVIDVGAGCGLLGIYLLYEKVCDRVIMFDCRSKQLEYAKELAVRLGVYKNLKIINNLYSQNTATGQVLVSSRFGSLIEFEKFHKGNKLITLRRTSDCEPFYKRNSSLNWKIKTVKREDGFELELLTHDNRNF